MIYKPWGFSKSPFQHEALPASGDGRALLLGRNREISVLQQQIENGPKIAAIEGVNGIGKTSIANVTSYWLYQLHIEGADSPLFIPCDQKFQRLQYTNCDDFVTHVLRGVVQTLIRRKNDLLKTTSSARTKQLDRYLNDIEVTSHSLGSLCAGG